MLEKTRVYVQNKSLSGARVFTQTWSVESALVLEQQQHRY